FICVYIGASWTIRVQYFILGIMILSILSFAIGAGFNFSPEIFKANLLPRWAPGHSLFKMFALFFPAVTGIMAGVNMSGDLKDPARSIPNGTFAAIGVSALVYASLIFLLAGAVPRNELLGTGFIMKEYAAIPFLIYGGVFCATLSSALGSMMGAPRVIQAFARDRVFKWMNFLGKGSGKLGEPRRATILTFIISQICIFAGDLDSIAPIITMFFLMTYGTVNLACFYEGRTQNPSFRPTFKYNHWFFSLFGALGCLLVMFLINPLWAFIALILGGGFYLLIIRAEIQVKWGDLSAGLAFQRARNALLKLEKERYHPKNWRPSILTLSGGVYNRLHLVEYSCWLTADVGVVSVAQIILGELEKLISHRKEAETLLRKFLRKEKLPAFPIVLVENDLHSATKALIQCHGIGGMRPNTVLMGWSPEPSKSIFFKKIINTVIEMKRSLLILATKQKEDETRVSEGDINIWWTSNLNGQFMLLLAFVLRKHRKWNDCKIRIIRTVPMKADKEKMIFEMNKILVKARIEAEILILPTDNPLEILRNNIYPSALIFVGIELKDNNPQSIDYQYLQKVVAELPCDIIFAHNAGDVSLEA
ncbi:MAG TPA: hypothetical protein P5270_01980, partial [Victivallales bacterium]|nr:hypothetical protein [Victivallales bacterium]